MDMFLNFTCCKDCPYYVSSRCECKFHGWELNEKDIGLHKQCHTEEKECIEC